MSTSSDPSAEVEAATRRFWGVAGRVGYPEASFDAYTDRVRPLMTNRGFDRFIVPSDRKQFAKDARTFYAQRLRVVPSVEGDVAVSDVSSSTATAEVTFGTKTQRLRGGRWSTTRSRPHQKSTLTFVRRDGVWLVDDAKG